MAGTASSTAARHSTRRSRSSPGESKDDLAETEYRHKLKKKLEHELEELYHHEVMGVYFTDFVTQ